jgi:hypothetical protein
VSRRKYNVGYKRPPIQTRWVKGQSGNPNGRPKKLNLSMFDTRAPEIMEQMAATFRERNKVYKDNWKRHIKMLMGLFPDGITIKTEEEWARFNFFLMITVKLSRYVEQWNEGGHSDSMHDAAVYAAMLEAFDESVKEKKK